MPPVIRRARLPKAGQLLAVVGEMSGGCPPSYSCIYNPGSKMINIDDVLDSLNDAVK